MRTTRAGVLASEINFIVWCVFRHFLFFFIGSGMKPRIKNHFRAHQLSIWLRLIPELHRAGMEDVISRHNLFKNHDDMDLYDGPVKLDSLSRLAFLEENFKQRRGNGTNNEYSLLNVNGK